MYDVPLVLSDRATTLTAFVTALLALGALCSCGQISPGQLFGGETALPELPQVSNESSQLSRFHSELTSQIRTGAGMEMVLFGDSIGASTFAGTVRGQNLRAQDGLKVLRALTLQYFLPETSEEFIERLGAITGYREFNAFTGAQPWSHRTRLEAELSTPVTEHTYAIPGARTDHLAVQIERFRRDFMYSPSLPQYIVISVGGNDFCDSLGADRTADQLYGAIRMIREVAPQALVMISGIPDVVSVFFDYDRTAFHVGAVRFTCRKRHEMFPMCARGAAILAADETERSELLADLDRYRSGFRRISRKVTMEHPNEAPVVYAELPDAADLDPMLAADCFHPGRVGHEMIARSTWQRVAPGFSEPANLPARETNQMARK